MKPRSMNPRFLIHRKWVAALIWYLSFCFFYSLTGNFHLSPPLEFQQNQIDHLFPIINGTVWIYFSQLPFLIWAIYFHQDSVKVTRTILAMSIGSGIAFFVFVFFPTTFPRVPVLGSGWTEDAFRFLYRIDADSNCFPSLHVTLAFISAYGVYSERKVLGLFALGWACLISISTLTTKQHYIYDVMGGAVLALCSIIIARLFLVAPRQVRSNALSQSANVSGGVATSWDGSSKFV